jgi:Protein of unknown function (DUF3168)
VANFLDELDGDFVKHLRVNSQIAALVGSGTNARIFRQMANQKSPRPYITYTQSDGEIVKTHQGRGDGCKNLVVHVYCWSDNVNQANDLAEIVEPYLLDSEGPVGDGTKIIVCNGGIVDDGVESAVDSSDQKRYWVRLVLRMVIQP